MIPIPVFAFRGPVELSGADVSVRVTYARNEALVEMSAKDRDGKFQRILVSPTHPSIRPAATPQTSAALTLPTGSGLFNAPPTFDFTEATVDASTRTIKLTHNDVHATVVESITVPERGQVLDVHVVAKLKDAYPQVRFLLATYAFAPGTPDTTWAPGLRKTSDQVIGDHFFRSPAVVAQRGSVSAAIEPNLDVLTDNRPIPTILDLDCASGVSDKPLLSYGFADHRVAAHVAFSHNPSMLRAVPSVLELGFKIRLDAQAEAAAAYRPVAEDMWSDYGHRFFDKVLPQAAPFADYATTCYPAAFNEKMTGGWFERTIDGHVCGGVPAGWGLEQGWVSWQSWFNQLRSAWGLRWWGLRLGNQGWINRSTAMFNLALAAPMRNGACPTTYDSKNNKWIGTLIAPTRECYYDLTNIAWKGIWLIEWAQLRDCPRREEVLIQINAIAKMLLAKQSADGSFPSWLDTNLKPVPMLDRSAQSALPIWFLANYGRVEVSKPDSEVGRAVRKGADFLSKEVVDQQRYYDFETFFSCSPKECLQRNGVVDDPKMIDVHTMQRPQNTLCMQWSAEALRGASHLLNEPKYMTSALKALDIMALYQNVWPIAYRKTAYTYGGFGVQNSDGEYNDARQAQFAETLCDFGAELGRRDLFERGVAAARASMTLINFPLHGELGIYPNPNYPLGLQPENCCHGGSDHQAGRTGFDWGEGSGLAAIARIMGAYGSSYRSPKGWTVLVDGVAQGTKPASAYAAPIVNPSFEFTDGKAPGWSFDGDFLGFPQSSRRFNFNAHGHPFIGTCEDGHGSYDDNYTGTITSPSFKTTHSKIKLLVGGGELAGVGVELIDAQGKTLFVERGHNSETMDERTWNVSAYLYQPLRIRIFDRERGGWGHVNVGWIRLTD